MNFNWLFIIVCGSSPFLFLFTDALTVNVSVGTSFRLKLNYKLCVHGPVVWKKDGVELCPGDEYLLAQDQSLILQNIHENHQGIYQALDRHHKEVSHYIVNIRKGWYIIVSLSVSYYLLSVLIHSKKVVAMI